MRQDLRTTRKYKMWRQFCELAGVQTYVNFPRHLLVLRPADRLAPIKVSNTIMAAVASMSASRSIHFLWPFWRRPDTMPSIAHRAPSYSCSKLVPHNPPSSPPVTPVLLFNVFTLKKMFHVKQENGREKVKLCGMKEK